MIELMNSSHLMIISKFYHEIFGMIGQTISLKIVDGTKLDPARRAVDMNCRKSSFSQKITDEIIRESTVSVNYVINHMLRMVRFMLYSQTNSRQKT